MVDGKGVRIHECTPTPSLENRIYGEFFAAGIPWVNASNPTTAPRSSNLPHVLRTIHLLPRVALSRSRLACGSVKVPIERIPKRNGHATANETSRNGVAEEVVGIAVATARYSMNVRVDEVRVRGFVRFR